MAAMDEQARMSSDPTATNEDLRRLVTDKEQLESEVLGLRAELQQLQTLSQNQKSEIQTLQLLVNETVEASSSDTEEVRRLRNRNLDLEQQLAQIKQQLQQQQQDLSLVPATFVRSIARKLGADTDAEQTVKKTDSETELMKSMVSQLEAEVAALKDKLRDTDARLQDATKAQAANVNTTVNSTTEKKTDTEGRGCDMCANYERQLVAEQARGDGARERAAHLERALKLASEELEGVRSAQDETVRAWGAERAAEAERLAALEAAVGEAREAVAQRAAAAAAAETRALTAVTALTVDRETLQRRLDSLERDNEMLIGQYLKKAEEMQNEAIDLPNDVTELQEQCLRLREQLIMSALGRERAADHERAARAQLHAQAEAQLRLEDEHARTAAQLRAAREELERLQTERGQMAELADKLRSSTEMIEGLLADKKRLQNEVMELRGRVVTLQQELDNSEAVQQDFVRLSQSLQVELERVRAPDRDVRWQHEDDVNECTSCHTPLTHIKKKVHCRHCGRIFCGACVSCEVASGPRGVPARVCSVCYTLLRPHSAPYFSTAPPHAPD
ncbi:early endosome antigen 1 isoform X2 [Aricia agestis]|uniref:early endosome antigen 1 isoform X2 n=1 Tax=Aricia agestis TaxID=91739 RepID=UPI001C20265F|nr:early endosome antigen 1 isoform X2 [Aricia agestis]